jgi:hypothetical protein
VGTAEITNDSIINADIKSDAAIDFSKLATLDSTYLLVGSAAGVATKRAITGDVTIGNTGVTAITAGSIVNADVNASAAIAYSKLNISNSVLNADINSAAAIATSKLAAATHTTDGTGKMEFLAVGTYDCGERPADVVCASATDITNADNLFTKAHTFVDGTLVNVSTGTTLPTGLSANTGYYVRVIEEDVSFKLYDTRAHALDTGSTTGLVTISDDGTGDQTFKADAGLGQIPLGITMPDNAIITGGLIDVVTTFADEDNDSATIAIQANGANDLVTATAISAGGDIWDGGIHDIIPDATGSTAVKMSAAKEVLMVVADDQLSAGKMKVYLRYVQGI